MTIFERLNEMRGHGGPARTRGLTDDQITAFASEDPRVEQAVADAHEAFTQLLVDEPELLALDEVRQAAKIQDGYVNFYAADAVNPYVSLAAAGPWLVTMKGAVVYDAGGYGMIGAGHAPPDVLAAMSRKHVMANIMTPQISQKKFTNSLRREIGHTRGECPFARFLCMNSGSERMLYDRTPIIYWHQPTAD